MRQTLWRSAGLRALTSDDQEKTGRRENLFHGALTGRFWTVFARRHPWRRRLLLIYRPDKAGAKQGILLPPHVDFLQTRGAKKQGIGKKRNIAGGDKRVGVHIGTGTVFAGAGRPQEAVRKRGNIKPVDDAVAVHVRRALTLAFAPLLRHIE